MRGEGARDARNATQFWLPLVNLIEMKFILVISLWSLWLNKIFLKHRERKDAFALHKEHGGGEAERKEFFEALKGRDIIAMGIAHRIGGGDQSLAHFFPFPFPFPLHYRRRCQIHSGENKNGRNKMHDRRMIFAQ